MQQLTLFSNDMSAASLGMSNRRRRSSKTKQSNHGALGLWSRQSETEQEMALFFLDIRNFTPLAEKHQASDVIHIVRKLFSTFQKIIRIHRGQIIETGGDGFYAAFGFDRDVTEAVNSAVNAGIVILQTLEQLNSRSLERNLGQRIEVGIGVHVGRVATGNLHLGSKDHFVVMGYPVNVASRLQAATKELNNNFVVSAAAYKLLRAPFEKSRMMKVNLKGVTAPCEVHLLGSAYAA